ncbi:hypothetical protein DL240_01310 [Lujinxingia litoralis]|uniref:CYTH domain-containing protein n=1 Tax=Lujinxingia litoralis TaxID=2211119 RepID=A0A328C8U8_9DELT|nr:CYTH domain-containing protein [Lujinxingia litoralis]RAL24875.1 hypothetical protein DL240_01310 [Lujinxingia litoralis]
MGVEIERKFLVQNNAWRPQTTHSQPMAQGYVSSSPQHTVRVRVAGEQAYLTLKGPVYGVSRAEFEYEVPVAEARQMLGLFCQGRRLEKVRHRVVVGRHTWEIDEFSGENQGLIVAEIELSAPDEDFERPEWLGEEVSGQARYYNSQLVAHPYSGWSEGEASGEGA